MLSKYKVHDSLDAIPIVDIKDNCIVCNTHLCSVIEVSWANLFEFKEEESISYLQWLATSINEIWVPVQLVTISRKKDFSNHLNEIRERCKDNDFKIEFEKDIEWFEIYYEKELREWKITPQEVKKKFDEAAPIMSNSILDSYIDRLSSACKKNNILEKRYFVVVSTRKQPKNISEKEEDPTVEINFNDKEIYSSFLSKLDEVSTRMEDLLSSKAWLSAVKLETDLLKDLIFNQVNFPNSEHHKMNENATAYWQCSKNENKNFNKDKSLLLDHSERLANFALEKISPKAVTATQWIARKSLDIIKPSYIDDRNKHFLQLNSSYSFSININCFGDDELKDISNTVWPILSSNTLFDLSVELIPLNKQIINSEYSKRKQDLEVDLAERLRWKWWAKTDEIKRKANEEFAKLDLMISDIENKESWLFSTSINVTFRANSLEELENVRKEAHKKLNNKRVLFSETDYDHLNGMLTCLPTLQNFVTWEGKNFKRRLYTLEQVRHFYPFCPGSVIDDNWIMFGVSKQGEWNDTINNITFYDYFDRTRKQNSNIMGIGQSGSWKTTTMHNLIKSQELLGYNHLIVDFLGNYDKYALDMPDRFCVIRIDPTSPNKINPCDLHIPDNEYLDNDINYSSLTDSEIKRNLINKKVTALAAYYDMFFQGELTVRNAWILDSATQRVYERRLSEINIRETKNIDDVFLSDIVNELEAEKDPDNSKISKDIALMLKPYASWSKSWMFNSKTNVDYKGKSVVFCLKENESDTKTKELAILQAFIVINSIVYSSRKNMLVIDELARLFWIKSAKIEEFFRWQIATIRNLDWGVMWMTQFLSQIFSSEWWKEFFELSETKLILSSWSEVNSKWNMEILKEYLSKSSINYINNSGRWHWVLVVWREQMQVKIENHPDMSLYKRYAPSRSQ